MKLRRAREGRLREQTGCSSRLTESMSPDHQVTVTVGCSNMQPFSAKQAANTRQNTLEARLTVQINVSRPRRLELI